MPVADGCLPWLCVSQLDYSDVSNEAGSQNKTSAGRSPGPARQQEVLQVMTNPKEMHGMHGPVRRWDEADKHGRPITGTSQEVLAWLISQLCLR